MTKVEGKSGPQIQQGEASISTTDQRMQEILLGPGTEKEKVGKLENELKTLMEARPKTEDDKKDLEAEKRQIQNQLKDPKSAFAKLSPTSRHKLEKYFSNDGSIDSSRKQADSKSLKNGAVDRQRNRAVEERKLQENFMKFTPQAYEQKIKALETEIQSLKKEVDQAVSAVWGTQFGIGDSRKASERSNKSLAALQEKTRELEKLQAEYQYKFGLRPKPNMLQG
jgi:chromosome segregation ATPase